MDRCALFVDASYALGDGALAVHGTRHRDSVSWDYAGLLKLLGGLSRDRTGLPLLRCYWYDVAATGSRAAEHDSVADLPGVKLRLSKARPSRKEGVEAEMRKDLAALARNHAVSDVIIVSAEEDLAPAIAEVQEFGVRTILLHVGSAGSSAGSRALRQECDDVIEVPAGHLRPFVELIVGAEPQLSSAGYGAPVSSDSMGVPQPALAASGPRLLTSPAPAGYERASQLAAAAGQGDNQREPVASADAASFGSARHADDGRAGPAQQAGQHGQDGQHGQPQQPPLVPAAHYHQPADALPFGLPAPDTGFGQAAFTGHDAALAANGHGGGPQGAALAHLPGHASVGVPGMMGHGVAENGMSGAGSQGQGSAVPANGMPPNGLPASGAPAAAPGMGGPAANGLAAGGVTRPTVPPGSLQSGGPGQPANSGGQIAAAGHGGVMQPGFPAPGQAMPGQAMPGQAMPGQQAPGQPPQGSPSASGQHNLTSQQGYAPQPGQGLAPQSAAAPRHTGGPQSQNGLLPVDPQRPPLPGRQLPAGNGLPYGQDRGLPYAGQLQPPQFAAPVSQQPYQPGGYGAQPAQPPPPSLSVGDAVQAAHAEGFGFGEAVARDAPALWLEAVLARKPRMPSDLEARLLQGSALPIDSLLHDEVRHALRRGFWDALERSRH